MNKITEDKIIDKIKKLLALSESPNEEEAASALIKVKMLLIKYGLELEDIDQNKSKIIEKSVLKKEKIAEWQVSLISCITKITFTEALLQSGKEKEKIIIIGKKVNVITAKNLFEYLNTAIVKTSKKYRIVVNDLDSFRMGMIDKIKERLYQNSINDISPYEKKIVVKIMEETVKENEEYRNNKYGRMNNRIADKGVDPNSYGLGKIVGNKISLDKQISNDQ